MKKASPLPPGSVIGMLGAGQLGRMTALAAARLGYRVHVYAPDAAGSPAAQVCDAVTIADWRDTAALARFAEQVDVVTLEWENVPVSTAEALNRLVPVRPGAHVLATAQDRAAEKSFANRLGVGRGEGGVGEKGSQVGGGSPSRRGERRIRPPMSPPQWRRSVPGAC